MKTVARTSPYIRKKTSTRRMMLDVLIALTPVIIFAIYRFKFDFLGRFLFAGFIAVLIEFVWFLLSKDSNETFERRVKTYKVEKVVPPLITSTIFVLTIPSQASYFLVFVGVVVAIVIGKMIFGGLGANIFNPAGLGRAFVGLALGGLMGKYVDVDGISSPTALTLTFPELLKQQSFVDLLLGTIPGSMGEISAIAIIIGGIYLLVRKSADFRVIAASLLTFSLFMIVAAITKKYSFENVLGYALFNLLAGGILFGVVFMATDPVTLPYTRPGRLIFGLIIGSVVALVRLFGSMPEGMVFSLLIANAFVGLIDHKKWTTNEYTKKFIIGYSAAIAFVVLIIILKGVIGG